MKSVIARGAILLFVLVLAGCVTDSEEYISRYPEGGFYHWHERDFGDICVEDQDGNDITDIAIDLWYCANGVYNVNDHAMFEMDEKEIPLTFLIPQSIELLNYQSVVESIFTQNGISQLEQTAIGYPENLLIRKTDGRVYRMGGWKTGFSIENSISKMVVKELDDNSIVLTVEYEVMGFIDDPEDPKYTPPEYFSIDFTIANVDGRWLVDDYVYPEAF